MQDDSTKANSEARAFSLELGARLRDIAHELHGEEGTEVVAALLGIPIRTLENFEAGVTLPAELLLGFIAVTGANPDWLKAGRGPRFAGYRRRCHYIPGHRN
jgi:hypothetical protein